MEVVAQLSLYFPGGKCYLEKHKKTLNISDTIQPISSSFHQNYRTVAGHVILVTDDLQNVGQGNNLQKFSFLKHEYF